MRKTDAQKCKKGYQKEETEYDSKRGVFKMRKLTVVGADNYNIIK